MCLSQTAIIALDNHSQTDTIYTDFSKAFDRLDHSILLSKLNNFGFDNNLLIFFQSYLSNRLQYVEYRGHKSHEFIATSGAPQGSNLAPLLFSIFINDIGDDIECNILLFADDLKLYRTIETINDCLVLQKDLDTLNRWCITNKLPLNIQKCKYITFTLKINFIEFIYSIDNSPLNRQKQIKDLGVEFDQKLSFSPHINKTTSAAKRMLGLIFRNCKDFKSKDSYLNLYTAYVRSKLEYCSLIWAPCYITHIQQLESVQRAFMKYIAYKLDGAYPEQGTDNNTLLARFELLSLDNRRTYNSCLFAYKLVNHLIDCPELLAQLNFRIPQQNTRNELCFYPPTPRLNTMIKSPIYSMCNNFNQFCSTSDIFHQSISKFKKVIKSQLDISPG